jgi:hypothetical protein
MFGNTQDVPKSGITEKKYLLLESWEWVFMPHSIFSFKLSSAQGR